MLQSKLITLLRCFGKQELKQFELFLQSPYFNQSEKLVKFFRLIEPHAPLFDSPKLEKEKLYIGLHGKGKYNDSTMRELISEMFKLSKAFLAHEGLKQDELQASAIRFKWLFANHLDKLVDAELETRNSLLEDCTEHFEDYYFHRWLHDQHQFETTTERVQSSEHKLLKTFDVYRHVHSLNRDFLLKSFANHNYLFALSRIYKFELEETMIDHVVAMAEHYINKGDIVFDISFSITQLGRTFDEKYFVQLKDMFLKNDKSVPRAVMMEAGVGLENFAVKKIREGDIKYNYETMQIYRFEIENNYCLSNNTLNYTYYLNVAARGTDTGDLDWTDNFIETYKENLKQELREDCYKCAKAHILFGRRKFKEALVMALSSNIPFFVYKILTRMLVARAQYELGMLNELFIELETYRYHLKDEKLTEERRQHFQLFSLMLKQLGELKGDFSGKKWEQLTTQIEANKALPRRRWFREKTAELFSTHGKRLNTKR